MIIIIIIIKMSCSHIGLKMHVGSLTRYCFFQGLLYHAANTHWLVQRSRTDRFWRTFVAVKKNSSPRLSNVIIFTPCCCHVTVRTVFGRYSRYRRRKRQVNITNRVLFLRRQATMHNVLFWSRHTAILGTNEWKWRQTKSEQMSARALTGVALGHANRRMGLSKFKFGFPFRTATDASATRTELFLKGGVQTVQASRRQVRVIAQQGTKFACSRTCLTYVGSPQAQIQPYVYCHSYTMKYVLKKKKVSDYTALYIYGQ